MWAKKGQSLTVLNSHFFLPRQVRQKFWPRQLPRLPHMWLQPWLLTDSSFVFLWQRKGHACSLWFQKFLASIFSIDHIEEQTLQKNLTCLTSWTIPVFIYWTFTCCVTFQSINTFIGISCTCCAIYFSCNKN